MMMRNTIQRALVLDTVTGLNGHATADEVYEEIVKRYPTISRGTVYRNLNQLSESGKLRKVEVPDSADRFECGGRDHYHARCSVCGRIFDVDMAYMEGLEKAVREPGGFEFTSHDILFKGVCAECRQKPTSRQAGSDGASS